MVRFRIASMMTINYKVNAITIYNKLDIISNL